MTAPCSICNRITDWQNSANPYFIQEFKHSIFVVGDHQFHRGYCLVLLKQHVRELHDLSSDVQQEFFVEVMTAGKALHELYQPWKLNYACYGNQVEHVHWHIFPRYDTDPDRIMNPWLHSDRFGEHQIDHDTARQLAQSIRARMAR